MKTQKNKKPHIKKGDTVKILAGNHKNTISKVLAVYPKKNKATVKGANLLTSYNKATQKNPKGGIEKKEAPIPLDNLMLIDPTTKQPTRIGRKLNQNKKLQRYSKKTRQLI